jgi:FHS family L-fucose permease-like MFS transporter
MDNNKLISRTTLPTIISLFFFWGFVASSVDILIPVFKQKLNMPQWAAQFIAAAFYIAYTVGSLVYFLISRFGKGDLLNRIGYKNGIVTGLCISALGTLLFYPAAQSESFLLVVLGLFVIGLGFSLLQTAANPLTITMGDPTKGSQRLSLAGGINNIGSLLGPLLVSIAIFGSVNATSNSVQSIEGVATPYLILGCAFLVLAVIFKMSSIPDKINVKTEASTEGIADRKSVFDYPQLWLGMIGIFVYVGVEVSTASNLSEYMRQHSGIPTSQAAPFISLYWASLMIGRWASASRIFNVSSNGRKLLNVILPYLAFLFFLGINLIAGHEISMFYNYAFVIPVLIICDFVSRGNPVRQLLIFSLMGIVSLLIGMNTTGITSIYSFLSVGLFCSTLWPCIFTLAIAGLGKHTNEGSGLLIMMIMGGGLISMLQGFVAGDEYLGIKWSYLVGVACFAYIAYYAVRVKSILSRQGIEYDRLS